MDDKLFTPNEWSPAPPEGPHDHKGYSEEKCVRCGWVMGGMPLNCMNNDTPHRFPSQEEEIEPLNTKLEDLQAHIQWLTQVAQERKYPRFNIADYVDLDGIADEIDRLRAVVAELLPYALYDAEQGLYIGPPPEPNEYCKDCDQTCADCQWYLNSVKFMDRYNAGEFT